MNVRSLGIVAAALACAALALAAPHEVRSAPASTAADVALGRKLVAFGGCNDCHTPGWTQSDGKVPVAGWMTGSTVGFRGPWGTIYPANVRLEFRNVDETEWLHMVATRGGRLPMPWHNLRTLDVHSQRAIYRFIRSLGPAGKPAQNDVPSDTEPRGSYFNVIPVKGR